MKEKCLFLVNTPYQLMIAINLRKAEYANYDADVVITDNISDHKDLLDSVRCVGIFENVIAYNIKELYPDKNGVACPFVQTIFQYFQSAHFLLSVPYKAFQSEQFCRQMA